MQADLDKYPVADSSDLIGQVPVIDVGAITRDASSAASRAAVDEISSACREWGFFQVVNHNVPAELIAATWAQTRQLFAQALPVKEALIRTRDNPWGYYNNELTKNQRDKKEVFDYTTDGLDPIYAAENRWPEGNTEFRETMQAYRDACTELGLSLLQAFCVGIDLPADYMQNDFAENHTGFIRLNYYPVKDPLASSNIEHLPEADLGIHHHTDAGALTVLMQDDVGGLQVFKDGFWHNIKPIPGAFVINTGDMMQVWSNDNYQAAVHRVLAMNESDRFSIPFFFNPSAATTVSPFPTVVSTERPARYKTIHWLGAIGGIRQ